MLKGPSRKYANMLYRLQEKPLVSLQNQKAPGHTDLLSTPLKKEIPLEESTSSSPETIDLSMNSGSDSANSTASAESHNEMHLCMPEVAVLDYQDDPVVPKLELSKIANYKQGFGKKIRHITPRYLSENEEKNSEDDEPSPEHHSSTVIAEQNQSNLFGLFRKTKGDVFQIAHRIFLNQNHITRVREGISHYFALDESKKDPYKTKRNQERLKEIENLEQETEQLRVKLKTLAFVHDFNLHKAHTFLKTLLFDSKHTYENIIQPDSLTKLIFDLHKTKAESYLNQITLAEQKDGFTYFDQNKKFAVLGGLYLILGDHDEACRHLSQVNSDKYEYAPICASLVEALCQETPRIDG